MSLQLLNGFEEQIFKPGNVCHIKGIDVDQEIYERLKYRCTSIDLAQ